MTATLPQDTWRTRHDVFKVEMVNIANEARVPIECEVFGEFRHLIPVQLMEVGGELGFSRQRAGLVPTSNCNSRVLRGRNTVLAN